MRFILPFFVILAGVVAAESSGIAFYDDFALCNTTFEDADGYGIFWFNPDVQQGYQTAQPNNTSGYTEDSAWAVSVKDAPATSNASATTQFSLWYSPNNANYSDDFGLGYDVCEIQMGGTGFLLNNTIYRGQSDNGSCLSTLDQPCIDAIEQLTEERALELVLDPTPLPNSNLTIDSLPTVCDDIANTLKANWPRECRYFFNATPSIVEGAPMTQNKNAKSYYDTEGLSPCYMNDTSSNTTFWNLGTAMDPQSRETYTADVGVIAPLLAVFMPIANAARIGSIGTAKSVLTCAHVDHFNPGAYVPAALPEPKPIHYGSRKLSGGAIAGIVIGVVAVFILTDIAVFFWWRRRRAARTKKAALLNVRPGDDDGDMEDVKQPLEVPHDNQISELSPDSMLRPELAERKSGPRVEMATDAQIPVAERKVNEGRPAELVAHDLR